MANMMTWGDPYGLNKKNPLYDGTQTPVAATPAPLPADGEVPAADPTGRSKGLTLPGVIQRPQTPETTQIIPSTDLGTYQPPVAPQTPESENPSFPTNGGLPVVPGATSAQLPQRPVQALAALSGANTRQPFRSAASMFGWTPGSAVKPRQFLQQQAGATGPRPMKALLDTYRGGSLSQG